MNETTATEIGILTGERDYHVTHVQSLNTRVAFVALTFSGILLLNAMTARSKMQEGAAAYLKVFATVNGEKLRKEMQINLKKREVIEVLVAIATGNDEKLSTNKAVRDKVSEGLRLLLAEQVQKVALGARLPEPNCGVYAAVLMAGIGTALILAGLTRHSQLHMKKARDIQGRIDSLYTANSDGAPNHLFIKEPDDATGIGHHDGRIFLGIGCVWAAAQIAAFLLLYEKGYAAILSGCAIVPTSIVGILQLAGAIFIPKRSNPNPTQTPPNKSLNRSGG